MKITKIETGNFKLDGGALFGVVPKSMWSQWYEADGNNLVNVCMRSLLVEDGERKILIDTGIGDKQDEKFFSFQHLNGDDTLLGSLAKAGVDPADITDVFLTHLHYDHVGGAVKSAADKEGFELVFENAVHHVSKAQWEWANDANSREKASFLKENFIPIQDAGQLVLHDKPFELTSNIAVKFYHGHTAGLMVPIINFHGKTLVFTGDLIPLYWNIPVNYICAYDIRPLVSMDEKEALLQEALENDYILFMQHDIEHECCRVEQTKKGIRGKESFSLDQFCNKV